MFAEYREKLQAWGRVDTLPTRLFLQPLRPGQQAVFQIDGREVVAELMDVRAFDANKQAYPVDWSVLGQVKTVYVKAETPASKLKPWALEQTSNAAPGEAGSPDAPCIPFLMRVLCQKDRRLRWSSTNRVTAVWEAWVFPCLAK